MDPQFWINAWNEGRTAFHQESYHEKLLQYFPGFNPTKGQRVLVPLCGKSKDMLWLHGLSLHVHGVELHRDAVESFFSENKFSSVKKEQDADFIHYTYQNLVISCGDFFKTPGNGVYDFIYDRGSLVALPASMRKQYTDTTKRLLKKGGKHLLIAYEYDQTKMDGPPFSVEMGEVQSLYSDTCTIKLMESKSPNKEGARLAAVSGLKQTVYTIEKVS